MSRIPYWSISAYFALGRLYYFAQSLFYNLRVEILDELLVFVIHHLHIETHIHLALALSILLRLLTDTAP